jgi:type IV pilus assembly protein PilC
LRELIDSGYPVGMAIESAVPEVQHRESSIVESGERVGRLPQALARVVNDYTQSTRRESNADAVFYRAYPMVMMVVLCSAISLFSIFVMPKYEQIFKDFGTKLPPITQWTLDIARNVGPLLLGLIVIFVLISSAASLWQTIHPARLGRSAIQHVRDVLAWFTPVLHGIERDRGLADVFDLMSDALSAGVPADRALAEASRLGVNVMLARRIETWMSRVAAGDSLADAARSAGMPSIVVGLIATARNAETVVDVCGFLARYYRTRFSRTAAILHGINIPLLVLIFGFLVACVAISMLMPLMVLIQNMSSGGAHKWVL